MAVNYRPRELLPQAREMGAAKDQSLILVLLIHGFKVSLADRTLFGKGSRTNHLE